MAADSPLPVHPSTHHDEERSSSRLQQRISACILLLVAFLVGQWYMKSTGTEILVATGTDHKDLALLHDGNMDVNQVRDGKAIALLHFGIRKTATTTIQDMLVKISDNLLLQDHFQYYGHRQAFYVRGVHHYLRYCFLNKECQPHQSDWDVFVQELQDPDPEGGVIFSDEGITRLTNHNISALDAIDHAFDERKYTRIVALTYRHYFEWLLSEYNQQHKKLFQTQISGFVDWHRIPPGDNSPEGMDRDDSLALITSIEMELYRERFDHVSIFNLHTVSDKGLITDWLCEMVPWAQHTCEAAQNGRLPKLPPANKSVNLAARRIAQLILLHPKKQEKDQPVKPRQIREASFKIATWLDSRRHEEEGGDIPFTCLNENELLALWVKSVEVKTAMVPDYDVDHKILHERFERAKQENRICQIDFARLQEQPAWQVFFESEIRPIAAMVVDRDRDTGL